MFVGLFTAEGALECCCSAFHLFKVSVFFYVTVENSCIRWVVLKNKFSHRLFNW